MPILATRRRIVALCLLGSPLLAFVPFGYWVFYHAGGWFVSHNLEPGHRTAHLAEMFVLVFASFSAVVVFLGLLALFADGYRRRLIGWLIVPSALMAIPGMILLALTVQSYFQFR